MSAKRSPSAFYAHSKTLRTFLMLKYENGRRPSSQVLRVWATSEQVSSEQVYIRGVISGQRKQTRAFLANSNLAKAHKKQVMSFIRISDGNLFT